MSYEKWARLRYMPATPLYGGNRVTGCEEHIALSKKAACEGAVLIKNSGVLPFVSGTKLAVFGKAQCDYVKGGGGSGNTNCAYARSILEGLEIKESEKKLSVFAPSSAFYGEYVQNQYLIGLNPGHLCEPEIEEALVKEARDFADIALITLCRFSEETRDRNGEKHGGDYYLSREEEKLIERVSEYFDNIVVLLNIGGVIDCSWIKTNEKIKAALIVWQGGMEGGLAAAELMCGEANPSGRLSDTLAMSIDDYPSTVDYNVSPDYVEYTEDVFVGYRYFNTVPYADRKICYPFGFGLSYTEFEYGDISFEKNEGRFAVSVTVENIGKVPGKEVVQLYAKTPAGRISKPAAVLVAFGKTDELAPGEKQTLTLSFSDYDFASYDDIGTVCADSYILEKGKYTFALGKDAQNIDLTAGEYFIENDVVLQRLSPLCGGGMLTKRMNADGTYTAQKVVPYDRPGHDSHVPPIGTAPRENHWKKDIFDNIDGVFVETKQLFDKVAAGEMTLDQFLELLTDEQQICLLGGQPNRGVGNSCGIGNIAEYDIPNVMVADGPAGLRINPQCGVATTAFPCATMLCCTWNVPLLYEVGKAAAEEVKENAFGLWLAPAINIHRNPLCGRNFEYYSEDPILTGKMAASLIRGVQSIGVGACVKHFACNNKEVNRRNSDSRLTRRAMREIYLKAFEICVKEAAPHALMTAYNIVNGVRACENGEMINGILRGEWGYDGLVISDWWTFGSQYREVTAGNDVKMPCGEPEYTLQMLSEGKVSRESIRKSAKRVLEFILKLD